MNLRFHGVGCQVSGKEGSRFRGSEVLSKNEYRIMNVEGMYSARRELLCRTVYFKKRLSKAKPPFDILRFDIRYSAVRS